LPENSRGIILAEAIDEETTEEDQRTKNAQEDKNAEQALARAGRRTILNQRVKIF